MLIIGDRPKTVSESTVLNTELIESCGPRRVPGREESSVSSSQPMICVPICELTELRTWAIQLGGVRINPSFF